MKLLTKLAHRKPAASLSTFILGQKNLAPKIAMNYNIRLYFYGENEAEYGNPLADNATSLRDKSYYTMNNLNDMYLAAYPSRSCVESTTCAFRT